MSTYTWWLNELGGRRVATRITGEQRGLGVGRNLNLRLGRWGNGQFQGIIVCTTRIPRRASTRTGSSFVRPIPENRQCILFRACRPTPART